MCPAAELPVTKSIFKRIIRGISHPLATFHTCGRIILQCRRYNLHAGWNCRIINPFKLIFSNGLKNYIVLYPEIVGGNPLRAKNVSRVLMHNPGHFIHAIDYSPGELQFRYSDSFARDYVPLHGSVLSEHKLSVGAIPECFKAPSGKVERKGIAYALRKGKGKRLVHNTDNAVLIDDLTMQEVADLFKSVEMFVSYDAVTAFSNYALLCHCPSVIILGENESPTTYRTTEDANMYAYNIEEVASKDWSKSYERAELMAKDKESRNDQSVNSYIADTQSFFAK